MARQLVSKALAFGDPFANAEGGVFTVYIAGVGSTLAQIYNEKTGGTFKNNPFTVGADSLAEFYINPGLYRLEFLPPGEVTPVVIDEYLVLDESLANAPTGALQFATVADMINGTPVNGNQLSSSDWLSYVGQKVSTVVNNTTSKKGGAEYIIKTAAQVAADGDVIDGYANHWLLGVNNYAAIMNLETRLTPYHFGLVSTTSGVTYQNDAINAILALAKRVGGINLHHDNKDFSYFIDRPIQLRGYLNLLGDFTITHSGTEGYPRNRFIEVQPNVIASWSADSNNMTVGQNTIDVTGNTMQAGEYMMILAGDDPHDPNEERYREIVRVDDVAGATITFSPSFPGYVNSPTRPTTVHRFEHPCIGVKIGNVTFLEDSPLKTLDRCIQIEWCIGTEIGHLVTSYHAGTPVIDIESVDTSIKSITTMNKATGAATSYARAFNSWGNKNCKVGSIRGSTDNISAIFLESFSEVEFGDVNFPAFGVAGESFRLNGESIAKVKRFQNSITAGLVGMKSDENSTLSVEYISGLGVGALCSVGNNGAPPSVIEFSDGEKYRFAGWVSRTRQLNPIVAGSINLTDVSSGNCLATHVSVSIDSPANMSGLWYGTASNEVDILAYSNNYNFKQLPWSTNFGSSWPFNSKSLNTRIRFLTGASWPTNGYIHFNYAQYQKI